MGAGLGKAWRGWRVEGGGAKVEAPDAGQADSELSASGPTNSFAVNRVLFESNSQHGTYSVSKECQNSSKFIVKTYDVLSAIGFAI